MQHSPAHCTAPLWSKVGIPVVHEVGFCSCKFLHLPGVCPAYRPESWRSPASRTARTDCRLRHWVDSSKSIRHAKNCQHMSRFQDARIPSRPAPQEAKHERERWRMVTNGGEQDERWRTVTKLSKNSLLEVIAVECRNHVMSRPMGNTPWAHTSGCPWFKIGAASGKRISDNRTNPVKLHDSMHVWAQLTGPFPPQQRWGARHNQNQLHWTAQLYLFHGNAKGHQA